jgi:hypothetical protein
MMSQQHAVVMHLMIHKYALVTVLVLHVLITQVFAAHATLDG